MRKINKTIVPRNPFAALAKFRSSGSHRKSNKALRKIEKQRLHREAKKDSMFYGVLVNKK